VPSRSFQDTHSWPRLAVSPLIELVYNPVEKVVEVYVDGQQSLNCASLVASIDDLVEHARDIKAIEDLETLPGIELVECDDVADVFGTPEAELAAHASNLQAWVENDYDTHLLHCNIAFPLLVDLTRAGDAKARRVLESTIDERIRDGSSTTRKAIALMFMDFLSEAQWDVLLADPDPEVRAKALDCLPAPLFTPTRLARALDDAALWVGPRPLGAKALDKKYLDARKTWEYNRVHSAWTLQHNHNSHGRPNALFPDGSISRRHLEFMARAMPGLTATYPFLPVDLIRSLAGSRDERVRIEIAGHPRTPEDVLMDLAKDDSQQRVLNAIVARPDLQPHLAEELIKMGGKELVSSILAHFFYLGDYSRIRRYWTLLSDERKREIEEWTRNESLLKIIHSS